MTLGLLLALTACGRGAAASQPIPDVVGREAAYARGLLEDAGWKVDTVEKEADESEEDTVLAQSLPPGATVPRDAQAVTLTVAVAEEADEQEVPDVVGLSLADARAKVSATGLKVEVVEVASREPAGSVVGQTYQGRLAPAGATVTLKVAKETTHEVVWRVELWDTWEPSGEEACRGVSSAYTDNSYLHAGNAAELVGPDGTLLDAVTLVAGQREPSEVTEEPPPDGDVCAWEITFYDIPEVAVYELHFSGSYDEWPSVGLAEMRAGDWRKLLWATLRYG